MSSNTSNIAINCSYCADSPLLQLDWSLGIPCCSYVCAATCSNDSCANAHQYVCIPCYNYSITTRNSRISGRPIGIFTSLKAAKSHVKKNFDTHQQAMSQYNNFQAGSSDVKSKHNYFACQNDSAETNNMTINMDNDNDDDSDFDNFNEIPAMLPNKHNKSNSHIKGNLTGLGFEMNANSRCYYEHEMDAVGNGAKYLIGRAFHLSQDTFCNITMEEVNFYLKMSQLLTQLTQQQQKLLAEILLQASNAKDKELTIFKTTRVPTSVEDFEEIFLSKKNSIIRNLPHPMIKTTANGTHAFVSLIDVVANEMANATKFDEFLFNDIVENTSHNTEHEVKNSLMRSVSQSDNARKLFTELYNPIDEDNEHETIYLWLKEWRDAFDPNNVKSSRNQVWISTFTLSPPTETDNKGRNTYFMSLSGKADNHSEIDKIFGEEIKDLHENGRYFYHGGRKKIIKVKLGKLITCVDRPERASMFQVGDHNGKYSTFWGHAGAVDGSCKNNCLPSCIKCRKKRIRAYESKTEDNIVCHNAKKKCCNWNVFDKHFSFPKPKNYPESYDTDTIGAPLPPYGREIALKKSIHKSNKGHHTIMNNNLCMVPLSVSWLKSCLQFAHHNVRTHLFAEGKNNKRFWTKGNFVAYLRSCGVSSELINTNYSSAINGDAEPIFPNTWMDTNALDKCHYAGMHMVFLGHVKSNFEMISTWLSYRGINATFGKQANIYLEYVKKLRINKYFAPHTLSVTKWGTGNWVSENYVFLGRIFKFLMLLPALSGCKWMCNNDPNFITEYNCVLRFISASNALLSRIMSTKTVITDMQLVTKIYMDCMVEVDSTILRLTDIFQNEDDSSVNSSNEQNSRLIRKTNKQPNFVKSNSLGILSVADAHQAFGPLVLNWEGGYSGERKIQEVKPLLSIKRENTDWQRITLQRLYQLEAISKILDNINSVNIDPNSTKKTGNMKAY